MFNITSCTIIQVQDTLWEKGVNNCARSILQLYEAVKVKSVKGNEWIS